MTWVDDMKRDAVALAFPDWEWQESDEVTIYMDYEYDWSEVTPGAGFQFSVSVKRGETYRYLDADTDFFNALMVKGSER